MKKIVSAALAAWAAALLGAAGLEVRVQDRELELPLEGVILQISLSGPTLPGGMTIKGETGADGSAVLEIPDEFARGVLGAQFPGYETARLPVRPGASEILVEMNISGVIEGKELVVERKAPGVADEESGVSVAMDKRDMETTANIGLVEDVMNSIKTLPGVTYAGGWNAQPSIRGGYPSQMGTVLDGVYIIAPFHWGGAFSIFNPNMVESAKMSHGIFSARYGRAMSGLLEVTTINPKSEAFRFDVINSTTSLEAFAQIPLGKKAGLFTGGKITYMETLAFLNDEILKSEPKLGETIPTMPFIRDMYAKLWFTPEPELSFSFNAFFGSDGIGTFFDGTTDGIRTVSSFDWLNLMGFAAAHARWMPGDRTAIKALAAYNNNTMNFSFDNAISGTRAYSGSFLDAFDTTYDADDDGLIRGSSEYAMDGIDLKVDSVQTIQQLQGKLETDILISGSHIVSFGADEVFQFFTSDQDVNGMTVIGEAPNQTYYPVNSSLNLEGNRVLNTSAFALWSFGNENSTIRGEAGIRGDHFYLWNKNFDINTWPVANPRASAEWTPIRGEGMLEALTFSAGTGFFSMVPLDSLAADEQFEIESFKIGPDRSWFQIIGAQADLADDWTFRIEGYYKQYFNRLYFTNRYIYNEAGEPETLTYDIHTDGKGFSAGFDLMLQKKNGRHFDGYLSWSYVVTKYYNPASPQEEGDTSAYGEPLEEWFYPSFHRFHSLNLIANWKPVSGLTLTAKASLATGAPRSKPGDITATGIEYNGAIIERYTRSETYDEGLRNGISCPVDFRISYASYKPGSKIRTEIYFALEDVFVNLYKAKGNTSFDPYTGKEIENSDSADYNIGIPTPSIGYKLSY